MSHIWLDALTPKQLLLMYGLQKVLSSKGLRSFVTTRSFTGIEYLAKRLEFEPLIVGSYGKTLNEKLERDLERSLNLLKIKEVSESSLLISYPSPSAVRTAFGLSKKIIILTDTPHAIHAHRLTIPLSDYIIYSSFIEKTEIERFALKTFTRSLTFKGVDELVWLNNIKPNPHVATELGLPKDGFVIIRPPERYAAYYNQFGNSIDFKRIVIELSKEVHIALIPRYDDDKKTYSGIENVTIIDNVLTLDLLPRTLLVITGGATMAREAALMGVPSIYTFYTEMSVNKKLRELGFPLFHEYDYERIMKTALMFIRENKKFSVEKLRKKLEDPSKVIIDLLKENS